MGFFDFLNKAKKVVGNIYEGGKRVGKVLNTFGKVAYNIGRGIYDYVADNPFSMSNYYSFNDPPQRIINPTQAPYRQPPRILPLPPPSRQNNPLPPINPSDFYKPPERVSNSSSITDFLRTAKPRAMRDGGLINNRPKIKYVL